MKRLVTMPSDISAEKLVLASAIRNAEFAGKLLKFETGIFCSDALAMVFDAMREAASGGLGTSARAVAHATGGDERRGVLEALLRETRVTDSGKVFGEALELLAGLAKKRAMAGALQSAAESLMTDSGFSLADGFETASKAYRKACADATMAGSEPRILQDVALDMLKELSDRMVSGATDADRFMTGFRELDDILTVSKGDLILVAARPSMGKTSFALNVAENAAKRGRGWGLFVELEMSAASLAARSMGARAGVPVSRIVRSSVDDEEFSAMLTATDAMSGERLLIDESSKLDAEELTIKVKALRERGFDVDTVYIDYMQQMDGETKNNRTSEIGEISKGLKRMGKELGVVVVALAQLNRNLEARTDKRPMLADLRESGALEQDADAILFIYRDEFYNQRSSKKPGIAEIIIGKQRNGAVGLVELGFTGKTTSFHDLK